MADKEIEVADGRPKTGQAQPAPDLEQAAADSAEVEVRAIAWVKAFLLGDASLEVAPLAGGGWSVRLSKLPDPAPAPEAG